MKPTNLARRTWEFLSGTRLTALCLGVLIALSVAGVGARGVATGGATRGSPLVAEWLRLSALTDPVHSPWFIFVLAILVLNLCLGLLAGFPEAWHEATTEAPAPAAEVTGSEHEKKFLRSELETRLDKEAFAKAAKLWGRKSLGHAPKSLQTAEGLLLAIKRGRYNSALHLLAHFSVGVALSGAAWMLLHGFQARALIEEGTRSHALELTQGVAPAGWKPYLVQGKVLDGYFDPGFEIESVERGGIRLYERGQLTASLGAARGKPARFAGLDFHVIGSAPGSAQSVSVEVVDQKDGTAHSFGAMAKGQSVELEDFSFKVSEIQLPTEINGAAVELEYQAHGKAPERFWIFADFPDYDFAHRRVSAQHFTLRSMRQRQAVQLLVGREPGAWVLLGGLLAMAVLFWLTLLRPEERLWIRWIPSTEPGVLHKVELLGWSPQPQLFEPRFYRLVDQLGTGIEKLEASDGSG